MGLGGISLPQLLIILVIVVLIFGTKRLKTIGGDLGNAIKGFKRSMNDDEKPAADGQKRLESDEADAEFPEQQKDKNRQA